ncbi:hypothetical protein BGZ60DRAFT_468121 [Tricladium varicosporioides]|nr:hypothetical protein BGZ60DRAFT_468121 [Hymenoscyphus varicosporioides]
MSDDDVYEIPLQDQRVFGAGIKRKRVQFVPSSSNSSTPPTQSRSSAKSISDHYLKLVLSESSKDANNDTAPRHQQFTASDERSSNSGEQQASESQVCEICSLPLSSLPSAGTTLNGLSNTDYSGMGPSKDMRPHEASLAHQVCLKHSHPPSHLDRNRKGLAILSTYGWDPDARLGLGATGQGIQYPIKTKPKDDKLGIGVVLPKEADRRKKQKPERLDAGKIKKLNEKDKQRTQRLRDIFYQNEDVDRYLGND